MRKWLNVNELALLMVLSAMWGIQMAGAVPGVLDGPITNPVNSHEYYLLEPSTWTMAQLAAEGLAGDLATISDPSENQWVLNTFGATAAVRGEALWLGLNDAQQEGVFVWAGGEPVGYVHWAIGQPDNWNDEDYARMWIGGPLAGFWSDSSNNAWGYATLGVVEVVPYLERVFYVDKYSGDDDNDGLSPETAFATIQHAIDASVTGDVVLVYPGVYGEAVVFPGYKAIELASVADAAVIENPEGAAVSFFAGQGPATVLRNFVIRNSMIGIYCQDASPTIRQVTVVGNGYGVARYSGAGPDIENSIFWDNATDDLYGCTARYSCIQRPTAGEGNISDNPQFADPDTGDYHLKSQAGRYIPVDLDGYQWSVPELLTELNAGGEEAGSPCLSRDGLTMYFQRHIPSLGHNCIIEAYRESPEGSFTSERVLTELAITGYNVNNPSISVDQLQLYYVEKVSTNGIGIIKMATRSQVGGVWTPAVRVFSELHEGNVEGAQPALTDDELVIVWQSTRPGSQEGLNVWTASRNNVTEPFQNIHPLEEMNSFINDGGAHLSGDGLTIYINSERYGDPTKCSIFKAKRNSINEPFGEVKLLEIPGYETQWQGHSSVTPDEKTIYFEEFQGAGIFITQFLVGQWVIDELTSPCIDGGNPQDYPMAEPMPNGARVNMGAYGAMEFASKSVNPWPNPYDANFDGIVNIMDLAIFGEYWLWTAPWME